MGTVNRYIGTCDGYQPLLHQPFQLQLLSNSFTPTVFHLGVEAYRLLYKGLIQPAALVVRVKLCAL